MQSPVSTSASGRFGVSSVARGSSRRFSVLTAWSCNNAWPPLATMTGSATSGVSAGSSAQTASMVALSCSMPVLIASAPISSSTTRICWRMKSSGMGSTPCTPSVFCAVSAVMAVAAKPPSAVTALMSAWMPAPPPLSLPATMRTLPFMPASWPG